MGEIVKSPMLFEINKIPDVSLPEYLFEQLRNYLPNLTDKPWLFLIMNLKFPQKIGGHCFWKTSSFPRR
jgi:hypothetical protein